MTGPCHHCGEPTHWVYIAPGERTIWLCRACKERVRAFIYERGDHVVSVNKKVN